MDLLTVLLLAAGLVLLVVGAEALVRGASGIADTFGVSPLVIGLTVVAFGTSSPELAVALRATFAGQGDIAIGNVVGSNIFNILAILGVAAIIAPLAVSQQLVRLDVPLMIGISMLLLLLALDGRIGRLDGLLLFVGIVAYTVALLRQSRKETAEIRAEYDEAFGAQRRPGRPVWLDVTLAVVGLGLLVLGSRWLVDGAVAIARWIGLSELVIGLTIIAAGTSLPELATSVLASFRGERDIAVGNVVGSNIFNILAILGLTGLLAPSGIEVAGSVLSFDLPVMIAVAVACIPVFFTGQVIARWEGWLFLGYYAAYAAYLALAPSQHDSLGYFSDIMIYFVLPITALTLAITFARHVRSVGRHSVWVALVVAGTFLLSGCDTDSRPAGDATAGGREQTTGYRGILVEPGIPKVDFTLRDTKGEPYDFRARTDGKVVLLFFGYTSCPDICPVHLANLSQVLETLPWEVRERIQVVFVSTDPIRDTPERVREWLDQFDPGFVGLTGTLEEVNQVQASFGLPPAIVQESPGGEPQVGHASQILAFTPDERAHLVYPFGTRQADWANDLPRLASSQEWSGGATP